MNPYLDSHGKSLECPCGCNLQVENVTWAGIHPDKLPKLPLNRLKFKWATNPLSSWGSAFHHYVLKSFYLNLPLFTIPQSVQLWAQVSRLWCILVTLNMSLMRIFIEVVNSEVSNIFTELKMIQWLYKLCMWFIAWYSLGIVAQQQIRKHVASGCR